jgi:hypothetical protein
MQGHCGMAATETGTPLVRALISGLLALGQVLVVVRKVGVFEGIMLLWSRVDLHWIVPCGRATRKS